VCTTVYSNRPGSVKAFDDLIGGDIPPAFVINTCSLEEFTPHWLEKNFYASRIVSRAIFPGKNDTLDRLLQLAGKAIEPADFLAKIVARHYAVRLADFSIFTFLEMFIWLDSLGHSTVDSNLLRAIQTDALSACDARDAMNRFREVGCSTCSLISRKCFDVHFKMGSQYFQGAIVIGGEGCHVHDLSSWRHAEKTITGVLLDVGHIVQIRCSAKYRSMLKKDRMLMWSHRVFRHYVFHSSLETDSEASKIAELIVCMTDDTHELRPFRHLAARLLMGKGFSGLPSFQKDNHLHACVEDFDSFVSSTHFAYEQRLSDRQDVDDWIAKFCV